jgi:hypothetical protein
MYGPMYFVLEFIFAVIGLYLYINFLFPLMIDISNEELSDPYNVIKNETLNNVELLNNSMLLNESYYIFHYRNVYAQ